jgi:1-deoxyxylulose-5-phosphate synthase
MRYARLGGSGLTVSRIGLGMMSFGDPAVLSWALDGEAEPVVRRAVEAGVTLFDTADMYGDGASEEVTGALLRRLFARRDEYVLATKVFYPTGPGPNDRGLSRAHIMSAVDASLRRLGIDHVDLYQVHRWDPETPVEETMAALDDVVRAGKARYAGASLMRTWQFATAQHVAGLRGLGRFVSMQTRLSLAYREEEREMLPYCASEGIGVLAYSPLARGLLARKGTTARAAAEANTATDDAAIVPAVRAVATARGVPPARVALAWVLGRPAVTAPIVGVTRPGQVDDAVAAVDLELTAEETGALEAPYHPREPYGFE